MDIDPCLDYIAHVGAALLTRVQLDLDSKTSWRAAFDAGLVRFLHTEYGEVMVLTPRGRKAIERSEYIASPGSAALRAFQVEAGQHCESQGITELKAVWKKAGGLRQGSEFTDQRLFWQGKGTQHSLLIYPLLNPSLRTIRTRYLERRRDCRANNMRMLFLIPHLSPELAQRLHAFAVKEKKDGNGELIPRVEVVPHPDASRPLQ